MSWLCAARDSTTPPIEATMDKSGIWAKIEEGVNSRKSNLLIENLPKIRAPCEIAWGSLDTLEQLVTDTTFMLEKEMTEPLFENNQQLIGLTKSLLTLMIENKHRNKQTDKAIGTVYWLLGRVSHASYDPENARRSYEAARELQLHATDPVRLKACVYFARFLWDEVEEEKAIQIGKNAFEDAICVLENLDERDYQSATRAMQMIRDDLTFWTVKKGEPRRVNVKPAKK